MSPIPRVLVLCVLFAVSAGAAKKKGIRREILLLNQMMTQLQQEAEQLKSQVVINMESLKNASTKGQEQVAFSARYNGQSMGFNVGSGGTLKYDKVLTNVGNGYAAHSGVFTAPYAGVYAFYTSLRSDNTNLWILLGIYKGSSAQVLVQVTGKGKDDHWDRGSGFVVTHLAEWEQVYVKQMAGSTYLEKGPFTTFSGFLIAAD